MGIKTGISYVHGTWNCWQGCQKVSEGCRNCYMYREKLRYGQYPAEVVRSRDRTFFAPRWWKLHDGARIMVCSWSDFFHIDADKWRPEAWKIIKELPQYNFLIPTKRPEHIVASLPADWGSGYPNVWLGVSVENQETFKERVPILMDAPAKLRWLSVEPMLGPLSIWDAGAYAGTYIDWVVIGGESGPHCRPMENEWALNVVEECKIAMIPAYAKQLGGWPNTRHRLEELPAGLRVREYPSSKDWPVSLTKGSPD